MATITPTFKAAGEDLVNSATSRVRVPRGTVMISWAMGQGDTAVGVLASHLADKTVTLTSGSFGTSTATMEGSNDSTNGTDGTWITLTDAQGNAISKTANATEQLLENPLWIRPTYSAGSGTTLTATVKGSTPARG